MYISIHALREESDQSVQRHSRRPTDFNPRSPWGERQRVLMVGIVKTQISIHALREESDKAAYALDWLNIISIHALREESDHSERLRLDPTRNFNPRSPWGERHSKKWTYQISYNISIHALREESDLAIFLWNLQNLISIHALREESDAIVS